MRLAIVYAIIALAETTANLGTQALTVRAWHGAFQVELSAFVGLGVGRVVKYILDKIFRFRTANTLGDQQNFRGFRSGFNCAFQDKNMRYVGTLIGLALVYWAKYHLDKRFVFCMQAAP
jgi:putative flippase GtrA